MKKKIWVSRLISLILIIIIIYGIYIIYNLYRRKYFNDFVKAEYIQGVSTFSREREVDNQYSYKITSPTYNDAMFYKTIEVEKNTPYRVSCMVKTRKY